MRLASLVAWGQLCQGCAGAGHCVEPPTEYLPLYLDGVPCEACAGRDPARDDCRACDGRGLARVIGCPQEQIPREVWKAMELAVFAKRGAWPVAGGTLDQCAVFLRACRYIWQDEELIKAELRIPNTDG